MKPPLWKEEWSEPPDVGSEEAEEVEEVEIAVEAADEGIAAEPANDGSIPEDDLCNADTTPVPRRDS